MVRGIARVVPLVTLAALTVPSVAGASWHSFVAGPNVTMANDNVAAIELLQIETSGVNLTHNRVGDPGTNYASNQDFDSGPGTTPVPNDGSVTVTLAGNDGPDSVAWGTPTSALTPTVVVDGGLGDDFFSVFNAGDPVSRTYGLTSSQITGAGGGPITYMTTENLTVSGGSGNDIFNVGAGVPAGTNIQGGAGADRLALADGAVVGSYDAMRGTDTVDYTSYTTPVTVNAPTAAVEQGAPSGAQEVPSNASAATGTVTVNLDLVTNDFDLTAQISGITPGQVSGFHIHRAPPGANGPIIVDLMALGGAWVPDGAGGMILTMNNVAFPPAELENFFSGNTYFNVHTSNNLCPPAPNCAAGEVRGRIAIDETDNSGFRANGTGASLAAYENLIGGSAADVLRGTPTTNRIEGGLGADSLFALAGNDLLVANDGATDAALECGAGAGDVLNRDPFTTDPDSIISGCETVDPATPTDSGGGGDGGGGDGGGGGPTPPDNDIEIGKAKLNTKNGTAKLPVDVPGAGQLELEGKGVKSATKTAGGAGTVNLKVKPTGKTADKLDDKGKAKVTVDVTFTPTGGTANTETEKLKLKEK